MPRCPLPAWEPLTLRGRPHVVVVTFAVEGDAIHAAVDQKPKSGANLKRLRNVGENP